ncbi:hypothetical protein SO694_00002450 [Aureococcus anophagefferens]|uniref:Alpha-ketoglutarate-dependent dioxygenase AlkB-like domain-containing protein n=1 Tax=Aureococcus anophagefferens TaxID=44056 RepID=A0ABR1GC93_AURAN
MQLAQLVLACALATSSAAESTSSTADSWYKKGNPSKDCDWVAKYSDKRCSVKGYVGDSTEKSAYDVTEGSVGLMDPALDPIPTTTPRACAVNVHWHIGAEHRSEGQYTEEYAFDHPGLATYERRLQSEDDLEGLTDAQKEARKLASGSLRVGHMCKNAYDLNNDDPDGIVANEYDWQYCHDARLHHRQLRRPSSSPYLRPAWDALNSWDTELATDYAYYQGSTTGDAADNEICRGTGGLVTWHTDRECHLTTTAELSDTPYTP